VTAPQSVMHFAGAQGVRTEVIEPTEKGESGQVMWDRVLLYNDGKTPWYADTHCFATIDEWKKKTRARDVSRLH